tara:strand:- start:58 stop:456 length:399 start_codon:yes stop_codon:yes gene_type:complete
MHEYKVDKIKKVVDGDTVDVIIDLGFNILHSARIRLLGIDTPESRTRDLEEKKYGLKAKKYLKEQLAKGDVTIKSHKEKGKFGRVLGVLFVNGHNINDMMIENYHAVPYEGQSKYDIDELHMKNRERLDGNT